MDAAKIKLTTNNAQKSYQNQVINSNPYTPENNKFNSQTNSNGHEQKNIK